MFNIQSIGKGLFLLSRLSIFFLSFLFYYFLKVERLNAGYVMLCILLLIFVLLVAEKKRAKEVLGFVFVFVFFGKRLILDK